MKRLFEYILMTTILIVGFLVLIGDSPRPEPAEQMMQIIVTMPEDDQNIGDSVIVKGTIAHDGEFESDQLEYMALVLNCYLDVEENYSRILTDFEKRLVVDEDGNWEVELSSEELQIQEYEAGTPLILIIEFRGRYLESDFEGYDLDARSFSLTYTPDNA